MSISCPRVINFSLVSLVQALDQRDRICSLSDVQVNTGLRDAPLFVESHTLLNGLPWFQKPWFKNRNKSLLTKGKMQHL